MRATLSILGAMVGKDLRRRARAPLATVLLLLFPLVFAGIIALTFGGGESKVPQVRLLIEDRDGGLVGRLVAAAFEQGDAQKYFVVKKVETVAGDGADLLEREDATALLRLPAGLTDDVLAGRPAALRLVKSPAQSILPDVAEQVTGVLAEGLSSASHLLRAPLDEIRRSTAAVSAPSAQGAPSAPGARGMQPSDARVAEIAVLVNGVVARARPYVLPPVVTLETAARPDPAAGTKPASASASPTTSLFLLFLPGISVYALFNLTDQTMRDLLVEARLKTLRRQLAGPVTARLVLAGKALATAAVAALSIAVLTAVGAVAALAGPRGVSLSGYLLLSLALVVATTGFASAVFGIARGERQGATLASLLSLVMAFAGGSFIPLGSLPGPMRAISPASLIFWANRGYQKLVLEGAGPRGVLLEIAILAGAGALLLALSAPLWRRRLLRGDLA